jgi:hypothetical protein
MECSWKDIRNGLGRLRTMPGFAIVGVLTLVFLQYQSELRGREITDQRRPSRLPVVFPHKTCYSHVVIAQEAP